MSVASDTAMPPLNGAAGASEAFSIAKCDARGCKVFALSKTGHASSLTSENTVILECTVSECTKRVHNICYKQLVLAKKDKEDLKSIIFPPHMEDPGEHFVCSKNCYSIKLKQFQNALTGSAAGGLNNRTSWTKDGKDGPDDPNHSEAILVKWMLSGRNFADYRGNKHGRGKKTIANDIARIIERNKGCKGERTGKQVGSKIDDLHRQFKDAFDWANTVTGAGLKESDKGSYDDALTKKCKYYFDFLPIMADRASARPSYTTDDMVDDDDASSISIVSSVSKEDNNLGDDSSDADDEENPKKRKAVDSTPKQKKATNEAKNRKTTTSKKGRKKDSISIFGGSEEIGSSFASLEATKKSEVRETVRHHRVMEEIAKDKQKVEAKVSDLNYRMTLFRNYQELKKNSGWNPEQIAMAFPEMKQFVETDRAEE